MFEKCVIMFIVLIVLFQSNKADQSDDIGGAVSSIINTFIQDSNAALQNASKTGVELVNNIEFTLLSVVSSVQSQVNTTMARFNEDVFSGVNGTDNAFDKILNCSKSHASEISDFETALLNNITGCIRERITIASNTVTNIIDSTRSLSDIIATAYQTIQANCSQPENIMDFTQYVNYSICIVNVVSELRSRVTENVAIVSNNMAMASIIIASLNNLPLEVTLCFSARSATAILDSAPLVQKIVQCTLSQ